MSELDRVLASRGAFIDSADFMAISARSRSPPTLNGAEHDFLLNQGGVFRTADARRWGAV